MGAWLLFVVTAVIAVVGGYMVFRFDSMARATYALMGSFLAVAVLMLNLQSEFLFAITFLMMIGEMMIMVMFMIAFMMNPAGLNPMMMTHQPKAAAVAGIALFVLLTAVILVTDFPISDASPPPDVTAAIGFEMMGGSMLVFETAGVLLLTGMIAVIALTARRGRFGGAIASRRAAGEKGEGHGHHHGGGGHGGVGDHAGHGQMTEHSPEADAETDDSGHSAHSAHPGQPGDSEGGEANDASAAPEPAHDHHGHGKHGGGA
ncbi:NADH-quinone oxidoreductase subunit J family protein [Aurantimonas marina]|uniref:NADH-quinone oxidoreductase subunit J family protein n=1 Tax=Aurantimonas marina TaxID=2780508 RepID=UPI0019D06194|nr:NADH-quinone oxidoreductase subunit J [Aurantimonas marina]